MRVVALRGAHDFWPPCFRVRAKHGCMIVCDAMPLPGDESARLSQALAGWTPVIAILGNALAKNFWGPRHAVWPYCGQTGDTASQRPPCAMPGVHLTTARRTPSGDGQPDRRWRLREPAAERRRFGVQRVHVLVRRESQIIPARAPLRS